MSIEDEKILHTIQSILDPNKSVASQIDLIFKLVKEGHEKATSKDADIQMLLTGYEGLLKALPAFHMTPELSEGEDKAKLVDPGRKSH